MNATSRSTAVLSVALVPLWSSGYLAGTFGVRELPPLWLTFWRFVIACAIATTIVLVRRTPTPTRRDVWLSVAVGVLLQATQGAGIYLGLDAGVPAGVASLVLGLGPVVVAAIARVTHDERLTPRQLVGTALGCAGVVVAVGSELGATGFGIAFTLLGLAGFASGALVQRTVAQRVDVTTCLAIQFGSAAIVVLPLAAASGPAAAPTHWAAWGAVLWLAIVNSLVAVGILAVLLRRTSAGRATSLFYLMPPVTSVLAVPVLGQSIDELDVAALALTALGVLLVSRSPVAVRR